MFNCHRIWIMRLWTVYKWVLGTVGIDTVNMPQGNPWFNSITGPCIPDYFHNHLHTAMYSGVHVWWATWWPAAGHLQDHNGEIHTSLILVTNSRALGTHFLFRVQGPHHLNFQGPQTKFEGSLHWNTSPILQFWGVHWALRQHFTRAPLDPLGPREPWTVQYVPVIHVIAWPNLIHDYDKCKWWNRSYSELTKEGTLHHALLNEL